MVPPFSENDLEAALSELAGLLERYCGGRTVQYKLHPDAPNFEFDVLDDKIQGL
jgi:hypothetical protein